MTTVYLCTPHKLGPLNFEFIQRIEHLGFKVLCAARDTPQTIPLRERFTINDTHLKSCDIFVAILKDYGKDLTAEVGMAYALGKPMIGINYTALESDAMSYNAFNKIITPDQLETTLLPYLKIPPTQTITWDYFTRVDLCIGTIISVDEFSQAKKPAYKLRIDLGEKGIKQSSAQLTVLYTPETLVGKQVICVTNFQSKKIAGFTSEILTTGFIQPDGSVVLAVPERACENGSLLR